jgi:uncharacterized protein YjiS (DUF1127 family)
MLQDNQEQFSAIALGTIDTMEKKMRDYVLTQAQSRQAYGALTLVARLIRNWKHHRDLEKLLKLDDYLLRDMGLTRDMLTHLARLPLTVDVDWERERVLRQR